MGTRTYKTDWGKEYAEFLARGAERFSFCRVSIYPRTSRWRGPRIYVEGINGGNGTSVNKPAIPAESIDDLIRCLEWAKRRVAQMEADEGAAE